MRVCEVRARRGGATCLPDACDDANARELVDQLLLRDGSGQTRHVDAVVVAILPAVLATIQDAETKQNDEKRAKYEKAQTVDTRHDTGRLSSASCYQKTLTHSEFSNRERVLVVCLSSKGAHKQRTTERIKIALVSCDYRISRKNALQQHHLTLFFFLAHDELECSLPLPYHVDSKPAGPSSKPPPSLPLRDPASSLGARSLERDLSLRRGGDLPVTDTLGIALNANG